MSDSEYKEVRFDKYCKKCEHGKKEGWEDPCNDCFDICVRLGTEKPEFYKQGDKNEP